MVVSCVGAGNGIKVEQGFLEVEAYLWPLLFTESVDVFVHVRDTCVYMCQRTTLKSPDNQIQQVWPFVCFDAGYYNVTLTGLELRESCLPQSPDC